MQNNSHFVVRKSVYKSGLEAREISLFQSKDAISIGLTDKNSNENMNPELVMKFKKCTFPPVQSGTIWLQIGINIFRQSKRAFFILSLQDRYKKSP